MEVDAGEKTLHLKRFSQHPPSGARFNKNREYVNMACRKGTARPQPCVFLHSNFICKKQRNNRCLLRDSVTEFVCIGSQVLRWTVVSKTSVSQSHLTRQGDQIPSTTVAQGLKYLLVRESKIARKGGLCSDLKAKH